MMIVGVPAETKGGENRVAMTPDGVRELVGHGVTVRVQQGAGERSSITDDDFKAAGADITDVDEVWGADLVVKVKEPQQAEFARLRGDLTLFTYLHLAAYPKVAEALLAAGTTSLAYETVETDDGALPLLAPMSEVAGKMATQVGAHYLQRHSGGRGVMMGGTPGVAPAMVTVIGAGNVGWSAARVAAGMGARVMLLDKNLKRLSYIDDIAPGRMITIASNRGAIERALSESDLVVGAVLVPGAHAPQVIDRSMLAGMKPGAVMVDVAVDQGGCFETTHETSHADPVYEVDGIIHYAVGNIPGAVPHTSTYALTNATLPFVAEVATKGARQAVADNPMLTFGLNTHGGRMTNQVVADSIEQKSVDPLRAWG